MAGVWGAVGTYRVTVLVLVEVDGAIISGVCLGTEEKWVSKREEDTEKDERKGETEKGKEEEKERKRMEEENKEVKGSCCIGKVVVVNGADSI